MDIPLQNVEKIELRQEQSSSAGKVTSVMLIHLLRPATFFKDMLVKTTSLIDDDYFGNFDVIDNTKFDKYQTVSPLDLTYRQEPNSAC
jgi:hypothetical protein